jgi:hypothetical protein
MNDNDKVYNVVPPTLNTGITICQTRYLIYINPDI